MKLESIKTVSLALGLSLFACANDNILDKEDIDKSDISKFDDTQMIAIEKTINAEGDAIYIDVTDMNWSIQYVSCDGVESEVNENLDFKRLSVEEDVVHVYGPLEFRSTKDELKIRVYPNEDATGADDTEILDGQFVPWNRSSSRKITLVLNVGGRTYNYNLEQEGVEDPSLYPFMPENKLYTLSSDGGECIVNISTALFSLHVIDEDRNTIGNTGDYFPKSPVTVGNEWIKVTHDGSSIKVAVQPNYTGKERICELVLSYQNYFNNVVLIQAAD